MQIQEQKSKQILDQLRHLNNRYRYHIIMIVVLGLLSVERVFTVAVSFYVFMNPTLECNGIETNEDDACMMIDKCVVKNDFTGTYYNHLYCEKKEIREVFQSMQSIGSIMFLAFFSTFGDTKGRRWLFLFAMFLSLIGIPLVIFGIYKDLWGVIIVGQFLCGTGVNGSRNTMFIMVNQFFSKSGRQNAYSIFWGTQGLGFGLFMPIYYFLPEWYKFMVYLLAVPYTLLYIISYFFFLQTPHFHLLVKKNQQNFDSCIDKIAYYNNSDLEVVNRIKGLARKYIEASPKAQSQECSFNLPLKGQIQKIYKAGYIIQFTIMACVATGTNIFYYGLIFSLSRIGYNFGISVLIIGSIQTFAGLLSNLVIKNTSSKRGMMGTIIISWVFGMMYLFDFVKKDKTVSSIIAGLCSMPAIIALNFITLMNVQFFPVNIKSCVFGLQDIISQMGKFTIPYQNTLMSDLHIHPMILSSSIFLLIGAVPLAFLPDIGNVIEKEKQEIQTRQRQRHRQEGELRFWFRGKWGDLLDWRVDVQLLYIWVMIMLFYYEKMPICIIV